MNFFFNFAYCFLGTIIFTTNVNCNLTLSENEATLLRSILEKSEQSQEKTTKEPEKTSVKDSNFKIIMKVRDEVTECLKSRHEVLTQKPDWPQKTLHTILNCLCSHEYYEDVINNAALFDNIEKSMLDVDKSYSKFFEKMKSMIDIFRMVDYLTKADRKFFETFQNLNNSEIQPENRITEELNNLLSPLIQYAAEPTKDLIHNFIVKSTKTKFDNKPKIPSYVIFGILECVKNVLADQSESFTTIKKQFARDIEAVIDNVNALIKEVKELQKSNKIAQNTVIYLKCFAECLSKINKLNQDAKNNFHEYGEKISTLSSELNKVITSCLDTPKDQKIFDSVA